MSDHSTEADRSAYGPGAIALWVLLLLNLAWFTPYAVMTGTGIMQDVMQSPTVPEAGLTGPAAAVYGFIAIAVALAVGLGLAYGLHRNSRRDRSLTPA